jgi:electron transport complex protein RnfG
MNNRRQITTAALILGLFSLAGTGLVSVTYHATEERIAANERAVLLDRLNVILPPELYDNDIIEDTVEVTDSERLGTAKPITVYRARSQGKAIAAVLTPVAPGGYNGNIQLLVAILYDGTVAGVRVISHSETPGLGDAVEESRSDWIFNFNGLSLKSPEPKNWQVKRDGGTFDQFTGATITPRAIVKAVYNSLLYFADNRNKLFTASEPVKKLSQNHE